MTDDLVNSGLTEQERRNSLRLDMESKLVAISVTKPDGVIKSKNVSCVDISNGGISIVNDEPLAVGQIIQVQTNPQDTSCPTLNATVLRCHIQQSGWYNIGLLFQENKINDK